MANGFTTIDEIKAANKAKGLDWFAPATETHHGTLIESEVIGGFYFIESGYRHVGEPDSGRTYRAVAASSEGDIQYLSGGDTFPTADDARTYIDGVINGR